MEMCTMCAADIKGLTDLLHCGFFSKITDFSPFMHLFPKNKTNFNFTKYIHICHKVSH